MWKFLFWPQLNDICLKYCNFSNEELASLKVKKQNIWAFSDPDSDDAAHK
jgi:hypothetical protein